MMRTANEVERRLIMARALLLLVAVCSAALASTRPSDILAMVGWAFSLAMAGNFPALVAGHLVETRHHDRRHLRHPRRLGHLPVLSRHQPLLPAGGRDLLRDDVAAESGDRQGPDQCCPGHGRSEMARRRTGECRQPDGQQGRLVRPQQHQLRIARDAARLPGDLRGQPLHRGTVEGDAGLHRRDPQAARPDGARRKTSDRPYGPIAAGPYGAPLLFAALSVHLRQTSAAVMVPRCGSSCSGHVLSDPDLLVLSPAELRSGGADVHAARPRLARADRRSRLREITSGASSAASPIRSWRWSPW